jgi:hypothetical protein
MIVFVLQLQAVFPACILSMAPVHPQTLCFCMSSLFPFLPSAHVVELTTVPSSSASFFLSFKHILFLATFAEQVPSHQLQPALPELPRWLSALWRTSHGASTQRPQSAGWWSSRATQRRTGKKACAPQSAFLPITRAG